MQNKTELRDYQKANIWAIKESTSRKQLSVAPTGTGKTVVFSAIAEEWSKNNRVLILVHRDELVRQTLAKLESGGLDMAKVGVIKAAENQVTYRVTVASVQTLSRRNRAMQYVEYGQANLVIIDEAHHAPADSYRNVVDWCKTSEGLLLGFTATPDRETQKQFLKRKRNGSATGIGVNRRSGMAKVFDTVVFYRSLSEMIAAGWLCDVVPATIETRIDLDEIGVSGGDWKEGELGDAMERAQSDDSIVNSWLRSDAFGRPTLCFLPTVRMSILTMDAFTKAGVTAAHIDANTPVERRQSIYKQLRDGQIKVVCNCMVLTEGFDEPSVSCIIVARPTQSRLLFAQMIGRGTRLFPDKKDCLVMSVVGHSLDIDPLTLQSFLDDPGWENTKTYSARQKEIAEEAETSDEEMEFDREEALAFVQNFQISAKAKFIWTKTANMWNLNAGDRQYYRIIENGLVQGYRTYDLLDLDGQMLIHEADLAFCVSTAEQMLRKNSNGTTVLVDPNASWREKDPTPNQLWKANKLGIRTPYRQISKDQWELVPGKTPMTRGELSIMIDQKALSEEPTEKQIKFLRRYGYKTAAEIAHGIKGTPLPLSKSEASQLIGEIMAE